MSLKWIRESPPHWNGRKQAIVGGAPAGVFDIGPYGEGDAIPGEWWRAEDDGVVVGYGWMDTTWGEAEILLAVDPAARGRGAGTFILDQLEREADAAGLNYMYNVVRPRHPDRDTVRAWLEKRGFEEQSDGRLLRKVRAR